MVELRMGINLLFASIITFFLMVSCKPVGVQTTKGGYVASVKPSTAVGLTGSSISLVTPSISPNFYTSITLSVNGVVEGETVQLFSDSFCNRLIASSVATRSSVLFTVDSLVVGVYKFYTKSYNSFGSGNCSTKYLTYSYLGGAPKIASSISMSTPTSSPGYISTPTILLSGVIYGETVKLYKDSACSQLVGSAVAGSSSVQITSSALPVGITTFYTSSSNRLGSSACSTNSLSYNYLGNLPTTASSITLSNPASSPGNISTPTFLLSGVISGETVKIYKNSTCTELMGSSVASSTSVQVVSSALSAGAYTFYTRSTNLLGTSACSTISLAYNYLGDLPTTGSSIALSSPASSPGYDSTPTLLVSGVVSGETVKIFKDSSCTQLMGSAVSSGSTVQVTSSLLTPAVYSFYTATTNSLATSSCSSFSVAYNFLGNLPTTATSIALSTPTSSPGYNSTPVFLLGGVVSGETVKIYKDSSCSQLMGSAVAASTSVLVTSSAISTGVYSFYTNTTNTLGTSACSTILISYNYLGIFPTVATSISLYSPAVSPEYDSTPTFTLNGVVSGETIKLYKNASCTELVGSALASTTTARISSIALPVGTYSFYTTSTNSVTTTPCSGALISYQYLGVFPISANTLTLTSPTSSPNYASSLTFLASGGVAAGDTVKIYTDSTCTTLVGSALSTAASVNVTLTAPLSTIQIYNFYTLSSNSAGTSSCSTLRASYDYRGPSPTVTINWTANREKAVNSAGGGYIVYYSTINGFDPADAIGSKTVPYVSGATAPTTTTINTLMAGTYYFKIVAYSALNPIGGSSGSVSVPSSQFSLSLP